MLAIYILALVGFVAVLALSLVGLCVVVDAVEKS